MSSHSNNIFPGSSTQQHSGDEDSDVETGDEEDIEEAPSYSVEEQVIEERENTEEEVRNEVEMSRSNEIVQEARSQRRGANYANWQSNVIPVSMPMFTGAIDPQRGGNLIYTPVDSFSLFFSDALLKLFCEHTNRYIHSLLAQTQPLKTLRGYVEVSVPELKEFLAILFYLGIKRLPNETMHWYPQNSKFFSQWFSSIMSYKRFRQIKRCLSIAMPTAEENEKDKLAKVRSLITHTTEASNKYYIPDQDLGLDESQILCCGRNARVSHRSDKFTNKPLKDYIKSFAIHESKTGYCVNFRIDDRVPEKDITRKVVLRLCTSSLPKRPYKIATDRYYTSVDTATSLLEQGFYMYGTMRTDRGVCKELISKKKEVGQGEFVWKMATPSMLCGVWKDSDYVAFFSTCHSPEATTVSRRRRKEGIVETNCPVVMKEYNDYMGACERCNALKNNYSCQLQHKRRWYMCIIYYCFELMVINSLILYKQTSGTSISHLQYRNSVIDSLASASLTARRPPSGRECEYTPPLHFLVIVS